MCGAVLEGVLFPLPGMLARGHVAFHPADRITACSYCLTPWGGDTASLIVLVHPSPHAACYRVFSEDPKIKYDLV